MSIYTIQAPDGRKLKIEAGDEATAIRGAEEWYASQQKAPARSPRFGASNVGSDTRIKGAGKPNALLDMVAGGASGLLSSANQIAGQIMGGPGQLNPFPSPTKRLDPLGQVMSNPLNAMGVLARTAGAPQIADRLATAGAGGDYYEPQTVPGQYARTVGQMAPNALLPGGVATRAANVLAPALASETAGQLTKGTPAEPWARVGGAVIGGVGANLRINPRAIPRPRARVPIADTVEQLRAAKGAAYQAVDDANVTYSPEAMGTLATGIGDEMASARLSPMRHPKASSMVADIKGMADAGEAPTITDLDQLRQVVRRDVANATDPAEQFMGQKIIANIDEFIGSAGEGQVVSGNAEAAAELIARARDFNSRYRKAEAVSDALESARLQAGATGSGGNINNATRQALKRVLQNTGNLTAEESAALDRIVVGDPLQNTLRQIGKMSPEGNGLMQALHLGAILPTGGASGVAAVGGAVSKRAADAMTQRRVADLVELMAQGGTRGAEAEQQLVTLAQADPTIAPWLQSLLTGTMAGGLATTPATQ